MFRLLLVLFFVTDISVGTESSYFKFKRELNIENSDESSQETPPILENYQGRGEWAKGNLPGKKIELNFIPFKSYSQTRIYNTIKRLPQSAALEEAANSEEARNAPRLREVLSHKKTQQVYEEEGYEDLGYDHAGYNHHGENYESIEKEEDSKNVKISKKEAVSDEDISESSAEEIKAFTTLTGAPLPISSWKSRKTETNKKILNYNQDQITISPKPQIETIDSKFIFLNGEKIPIYKKTTKTDNKTENLQTAETNSGFARFFEGRVINDPKPTQSIKFPGKHTKRQYAFPTSDVFVQETVAYPVNIPFYHYIAPTYPNYYTEIPYQPVRNQYRSKRPSNNNTGPVQFSDASSLTVTELNETTTQAPNVTEYLDLIQPRNQSEPKQKTVRKYNIFKRNPIRVDYGWTFPKPALNTRHPSIPKDSTLKTDSLGPVKYIEQLTMASYNGKVFSRQNNDLSSRFVELAKHLNEEVSNKHRNLRKKRDIQYDRKKYPFYKARHRNPDSALKYASNPALIPKKTGGMEFYESHDQVKCKEPEPPIVDENEKPDLPRIKNVGDSIDCFKDKYFGKEPLDNPFFQEEFNESQKRLMVIPRNENNTRLVYNYTEPEISQKIVYDNQYKNHRPDTTVPTFIQYPDYYPEDSTLEGSKRHRYYHPKIKHKYKRKRYKLVNRHPVSIYSIISSNGHPSYYRPLILAHSVKNHQFIPVIEALESPPSSDSMASDSQTNYDTHKPTKFYIVRPGEYTENQELASEKKEPTSIWSYMNPLKWWFPNLFDNRRKEPRYRKKRNTDVPYNHKPEKKSIKDIRNKMNATRTRLNRLAGGYVHESTEPTTRSLIAPTIETNKTYATPKMSPKNKKSDFDEFRAKKKKPKIRDDYKSYLTQMDDEKKTLTYIVDPITGLGSWDEEPKKRKHHKRMENYKKIFNYPELYYQEAPRKKKQRDIQNFDREREAYILSLLTKVPPFYARYYNKPRHIKEKMPEIEEYESVEKADDYYEEPTTKRPKFILEPDKRKYYYLRD